ncbi:MAG: hypothetical protein K9N06_04155 [Candidatus Cloacimonetes bacterium]|nr:hypothetical protein [Candidatus Cloacimonadota bacterium]
MAKFRLLVLLLALLFLLSGCGTHIYLFTRDEYLERVNLIENSGFEVVDNMGSELPAGWIILDDCRNKIFLDDQISHSGEKSLKIKKPEQQFKLTSDSFNVDPTCSYYCRCFIKANKTCKDPVVFYFFTFDRDSHQVNRFSKRIYPTDEWTEVEITTDNMNMNSVFGRIVLSIPSEADINIWVDDVESYTICENK